MFITFSNPSLESSLAAKFRFALAALRTSINFFVRFRQAIVNYCEDKKNIALGTAIFSILNTLDRNQQQTLESQIGVKFL